MRGCNTHVIGAVLRGCEATLAPSAVRSRGRGRATPLLWALPCSWSDLERFLDCLIFRPRRTFGREFLDLCVAEFFAQCGHEFLVAPLLRRLTLAPELFVLDVDVADESRCSVDFSAQRQEQREMLNAFAMV